MSVDFCRESPGKFDSKTLNRKTLNRWTGRETGFMDVGFSTFHVHALSFMCIYFCNCLYFHVTFQNQTRRARGHCWAPAKRVLSPTGI